VTSGGLLPAYFRDHGLAGARTAVLGTADSLAFVRAGGGVPIELGEGMEVDAVALCDDAGFDFLRGIELVLSAIVRAIDAGQTPALVLPNPDLVYPKGGGELGFTAGAMALVIEAALARRFPAIAPRFVPLGKPHAALLLAGAQRLAIDPARLVMIGDQLETDVAAARAAGISPALLEGVTRWAHASASASIAPDWLLDHL